MDCHTYAAVTVRQSLLPGAGGADDDPQEAVWHQGHLRGQSGQDQGIVTFMENIAL